MCCSLHPASPPPPPPSTTLLTHVLTTRTFPHPPSPSPPLPHPPSPIPKPPSPPPSPPPHLQHGAPPQVVGHQGLVRLRQAQLPGQARVLDAGPLGSTCEERRGGLMVVGRKEWVGRGEGDSSRSAMMESMRQTVGNGYRRVWGHQPLACMSTLQVTISRCQLPARGRQEPGKRSLMLCCRSQQTSRAPVPSPSPLYPPHTHLCRHRGR